MEKILQMSEKEMWKEEIIRKIEDLRRYYEGRKIRAMNDENKEEIEYWNGGEKALKVAVGIIQEP